ncbi:UDP-N-acetylmuramoyl-L-alanyl-D-glutamate--2,6-diaminopimelate ligase [Candidatus Curtissbacteria bacterium]|nr:UDP-N-acetylmuramoyl-L-alanyl-D-glutamate--2,6-diaminopimelate ligase [Candidatus Curtissbacteria bacterium]
MWQKIKNIYHLLTAFVAAAYFNFPSKKLTVIGVTGTDGKTTTVNMIYHILKQAGKKVSMISSVNAQIGDKIYDTGFHVTTPDPWQIQKYLKQAVESDSQYFVLEATSHGLDQNRLAFVDFKIGAITNITHEHLDYHKTWVNYALAKSKLFTKSKISILNKDEKKSFLFLKDKVGGQIISYAKSNEADVSLKKYPLKLQIPGSFNLSNALAATAVCKALKVNRETILDSLSNFKGVIGRLDEVDLGQDFRVIIDFAHTPNGLKNALTTLKAQLESNKSKLIAVFGAAGERDKPKRQLMGKVADQISDIIVLTAEDPRSEKVDEICEQITRGITSKKEGQGYFVIVDRKDAIQFAINLAKKDDVVATFGKSHEKSMTYGKKDYPWNEFAVVKKAIKNRLK